jgi:hypothetical protein
MTTIERALEEFLSEQERRLKPRTYDEYEEVIYLFKWYLHGFAYVYLSEENSKYYDELFNKKDTVIFLGRNTYVPPKRGLSLAISLQEKGHAPKLS